MPHRAHLFSLREACFTEHYGAPRFTRDLLAGITVGIIAIPLLGGSRFSYTLADGSTGFGIPPQLQKLAR